MALSTSFKKRKFGDYDFQVCSVTNYFDGLDMRKVYNETYSDCKQTTKMTEYTKRPAFMRSVVADFDNGAKKDKIDREYIATLIDEKVDDLTTLPDQVKYDYMIRTKYQKKGNKLIEFNVHPLVAIGIAMWLSEEFASTVKDLFNTFYDNPEQIIILANTQLNANNGMINNITTTTDPIQQNTILSIDTIKPDDPRVQQERQKHLDLIALQKLRVLTLTTDYNREKTRRIEAEDTIAELKYDLIEAIEEKKTFDLKKVHETPERLALKAEALNFVYEYAMMPCPIYLVDYKTASTKDPDTTDTKKKPQPDANTDSEADDPDLNADDFPINTRTLAKITKKYDLEEETITTLEHDDASFLLELFNLGYTFPQIMISSQVPTQLEKVKKLEWDDFDITPEFYEIFGMTSNIEKKFNSFSSNYRRKEFVKLLQSGNVKAPTAVELTEDLKRPRQPVQQTPSYRSSQVKPYDFSILSNQGSPDPKTKYYMMIGSPDGTMPTSKHKIFHQIGTIRYLNDIHHAEIMAYITEKFKPICAIGTKTALKSIHKICINDLEPISDITIKQMAKKLKTDTRFQETFNKPTASKTIRKKKPKNPSTENYAEFTHSDSDLGSE